MLFECDERKEGYCSRLLKEVPESVCRKCIKSVILQKIEEEGKDLKSFYWLYKEYINTIKQYNTELIGKHQELAEKIWNNPDSEIYLIKQETIPVGFIVLGTGANCHEDCDYYIQDFFVTAMYTRKHIGINALRNLPDNKLYCLYVYKRNEVAQDFWQYAFAQYGKMATEEEVSYVSGGNLRDFYAFRLDARPNMVEE